jgi:hypothetical protein
VFRCGPEAPHQFVERVFRLTAAKTVSSAAHADPDMAMIDASNAAMRGKRIDTFVSVWI